MGHAKGYDWLLKGEVICACDHWIMIWYLPNLQGVGPQGCELVCFTVHIQGSGSASPKVNTAVYHECSLHTTNSF